MALELVGGAVCGSLALAADGLHVGTRCVAILTAARGRRFAHRYADDGRFSFGTGKVGDPGRFAGAVLLAMMALVLACYALNRFFHPVEIQFSAAMLIASLAVGVTLARGGLLSVDVDFHPGAGREPRKIRRSEQQEAAPFEGRLRRFQSVVGEAALELHKIGGASPRLRLRFARRGLAAALPAVAIETIRLSGERQLFQMQSLGSYQESVEEIPEPHDFKVIVRISRAGSSYEHEIEYIEPDHWRRSTSVTTRRSHLDRSASTRMADLPVSLLVLPSLLTARYLGWLWMDPLMCLICVAVIVAWAYLLMRDATRVSAQSARTVG